MKKITLTALSLGLALAFAGNAQAEQSRSPLEHGASKARTAVAGFLANGNGTRAFASGGYTRQLWNSAPYRQISRR